MFDRQLCLAKIYSDPAAEVPSLRQVRVECQSSIDNGGAGIKVAGDPRQSEPARVQCDGVVLGEPNRLAREPPEFDTLLSVIGDPPVVLA